MSLEQARGLPVDQRTESVLSSQTGATLRKSSGGPEMSMSDLTQLSDEDLRAALFDALVER